MPHSSHVQGGQGGSQSPEMVSAVRDPCNPPSPSGEPTTFPYHAEVYTIGDGVSPVFCTASLMSPSVPSPWVATISLGLSRLCITTWKRGRHEATSYFQQNPPQGHFCEMIYKVVLQAGRD